MTTITVRDWEGGIEAGTRTVSVPTSFMAFLDSIPCSCRGEAHDECLPEDDE